MTRTEKATGERPRRLAEWVSLLASAIIILGIVIYLTAEAFQPNEDIAPVEVQLLLDEAQQAGSFYVLPVKVINRSTQTLVDLSVVVEFQPPDAESRRTEMVINYLGERSDQKAYFYFDRHPRELHVTAKPAGYRVK
jgi:uncharacterized protein (TIGR02588 family)